MIYLDNNATTRIDDEVLEVMLPYLKEDYANASSIQHKMGRAANHAVENARKAIANSLKVNPKEISFNSGATEAINSVIKGIVERYKSTGNHIITCQAEHQAVLSTCAQLERTGVKITYLPVDSDGHIDLTLLQNSITNQTILVCIMSANNETGVIHPIDQIAEICQSKDVLYFCDATQSIGKQNLDLSQIPIDILCFSAHKFHGPKGIGALFIRRKTKPIQVEPLITGGKQENGFRGGTYNTANIAGLGKAIQMIDQNNQTNIEYLRNYLETNIQTEIEDTRIIGKGVQRLNNTSNILFKHVRSSELISQLRTIAVASGSACASGDLSPSHVLKAMHLSNEDALSCIRFSLSKYTTKEEIDKTITELKNTINKIRTNSPIWQMYKSGIID